MHSRQRQHCTQISLLQLDDKIVTKTVLPKFAQWGAIAPICAARQIRASFARQWSNSAACALLHDHRVHAKDIRAGGIHHDADPMEAGASKCLQPREIRQQLGGAVHRLVQFEVMGIAMDK